MSKEYKENMYLYQQPYQFARKDTYHKKEVSRLLFHRGWLNYVIS